MPANDPINHVVLLMLENRSFDQMLGSLQREIPDLDGIDPNASPRTNPDPNNPDSPIAQLPGAHNSIPNPNDVDFGHEPEDVDAQIGYDPAAAPMSGFVGDFRNNNKLGANDDLANQVMAYFDCGKNGVGDSLPVLHTLARSFVVCDRWFSSVPGPTWPNRLFALTGTAAGWREMWNVDDLLGGPPRSFDQDTVFNRLLDLGLKTRIYGDNGFFKSMMLILSKVRLKLTIRKTLDDFDSDVDAGAANFPRFAFIEPTFFGDTPDDQHPPHDVQRGEALLARVYNKLRTNQALWESTLLIVVHDEHGGFYDHVKPPEHAIPPDDLVHDGFKFDRLGVRVPAILVSPWLKPGVCHTQFDHASVLRYLADKFGFAPLGARAKNAETFATLFQNDLKVPRDDTPTNLRPLPAGRALTTPLNSTQLALARTADDLRRQSDRPTLADPTRGLVRMSSSRMERGLASDGGLVRDLQNRSLARTLRVLCVHGVGHGDAQTTWQDGWRRAILEQVRAQPDAGDWDVDVNFINHDDIFEQYPLSAKDIEDAILALAGGLISGPNETPQRGLIDTLSKVEDGLRWTAGMVMQWVGNDTLRLALRKRLEQCIAQYESDVVVAHSLGSLIAYDTFRRKIASGKASDYEKKYLITFGSQLAHPAVRQVFDGRIEPLHDTGDISTAHGFAQWFHLFNANDLVFTRRLPLADARTSNLETDFVGLANGSRDVLNHDGASYLNHPGARPAWLAAVAEGKPAARALGVAATTPGVADSAPAILRTSDPRNRRALIVGINNYPDPANRLEGCVNDAFLISSVLQEQGFGADDIRLVLDERATRAGIIERLEWLFDGVKPGDTRVFYYSGHGAPIPSYSDHATPDHMEESLVPYDFDWSAEHAFTDSDFRRFYSQLPYDVQFLAGFDCCYAAGMSRGGTRVRGLDPPDDVRHRMLKWSKDDQMWVPRDWVPQGPRPNRLFARGTRNEKSKPHMRGLGQASEIRSRQQRKQLDAIRRDYGHSGPFLPLMLFACAENQTAAEYQHGATSYGAFTFVLAKTLREQALAPSSAMLRDLIADSALELARLGYEQRPDIVGPDGSGAAVSNVKKYTISTPTRQVFLPGQAVAARRTEVKRRLARRSKTKLAKTREIVAAKSIRLKPEGRPIVARGDKPRRKH